MNGPTDRLPRTLMLLGCGELGKEVAIAAQRLGCHVIAVDRYAGAPAMQVADVAEVVAMGEAEALRAVVRRHRPDLVIPEIEALAVDALAELEAEGLTVIPTARATAVTMNRDRIRDLAAGELGLRTARYAYAGNARELAEEAPALGWPVVVKPVMSSSGKGQTVVAGPEGIEAAWQNAMAGARGVGTRVIVEEFLRFSLEITLLTVKPWQGATLFCPPIGHLQERGDYQCSWQPAPWASASSRPPRRWLARSQTPSAAPACLEWSSSSAVSPERRTWCSRNSRPGRTTRAWSRC